ncbi:hypothetical protein GCM10022271_08130 [Corallibacter vietnamensis]|uniref:Dialkylresorcinol condensing enzyme DarA n=1 Tax=Corallibacter vietnamensis TaxID=904130 RepID=A0ABP7GY71_9FLAO
MKHVLVLHYSQSGQLTEILNNVVSDMVNHTELTIDYHKIEMETPFPFPWSKEEFYGVFPDTYKQNARPVKAVPKHILEKKYDLIIFGYQVWYLTPSLPTTSFLNTDDAKKLFNNTNVVTVIGCRNLWMMAQEKMKHKLKALQANLVGNIALVDNHINHISVITIAQWMFSGKKERFLGIFPKPGVAQKDIDNASRFSPTIVKHILKNDFSTLQNSLLEKKAVTVKPFLVTMDTRGNVIFSKWAQIITSKSEKNTPKRVFWVKIFNYYLLFAIWIISPIVFILFLFTYLPLYGKIKKDKKYYSSVVLK